MCDGARSGASWCHPLPLTGASRHRARRPDRAGSTGRRHRDEPFTSVVDDGGNLRLALRVIRLLGSCRLAGIAIPFLVLFITLSVWSGPFLSKTNLINILDQAVGHLAIAAPGRSCSWPENSTLSVGAIYGLATVVSGEVAEHHCRVDRHAPRRALLVGLPASAGSRGSGQRNIVAS